MVAHGNRGDSAHQLRWAHAVAPSSTREPQGASARNRDVSPGRRPMNSPAVFGLSFLMSLLSSIVVAVLFAWPWLRTSNREQALIWLVAPHMFLRFIGLSFLVPGVVSGSLPKAWAVPAGYGDFVAGILAVIATAALVAHIGNWAIATVWIFNVWGAADLLFAFYKGAHVGL